VQISKTLLNEDARLRLPRFLEDETPKDPEATKQVRAACAEQCTVTHLSSAAAVAAANAARVHGCLLGQSLHIWCGKLWSVGVMLVFFQSSPEWIVLS
jgi:hypothetical protein